MTQSSYKARFASAYTATFVGETEPVTVKAAATEGGPPSFGGIAYSGGRVSGSTCRPPLDGDYVIDLSGTEATKNPKANLDHHRTSRVGHVTDYQNDGKQISILGLLSARTPSQAEVVESAANQYTWEISSEFGLPRPEKLAAGKSEVINGRKFFGPLYVFRKSKFTGVGFVDQGADEGNEVTIAASAAGAKTMSKFEEFAASLSIDLDHASEDQKARLQKLFDLEQGGKTSAELSGGRRKSFAEEAAEARKDNERQETIAKMGREAMRDYPLYIDQIERAVTDAHASNMSADQFELELLRGLRTKTGTFVSRQTGSGNDPKVIEAALAMQSGLPNLEKVYGERVLDAVDRSGLRTGFSLQQALLQAAHANGYSCRAGERITVGNIRSVLEYAFPPVMARMSGFSATTLPNILGAVANKMILAGYMESENSWRELAEIKPVSNFYTQNHYRMLDSLEYEEVGSGGELHLGTLGEETYTSQAKTYGKMLGITRTQIINDDLGAFGDLRSRLGRGAAKKFCNVFWAAFMNNSSFFTSALTNYIEGSTTNLGTDGVGLGLGVKQFRKMTTPSADGTKRVGVSTRPTKLLVPPELETIADALYIARNHDQVAVSSVNVHANKYRPIVENRLSDSAFTGYSTTAWFLFGDEMKPMLVTFLNGQESPTVESTDADFSTLGIQFRGYHDFGCDKSEYLAGLKSKGAT